MDGIEVAATAMQESFRIDYLWSRSTVLEPYQGTQLDYEESWEMSLASDGSFTIHRSWRNYTEGPHHTVVNGSMSIGPIAELKESLLQEGFLNLRDEYNDYNSVNGSVTIQERFRLKTPEMNKTVTFFGRSAVGLIPRSYAMTLNLASAPVLSLNEPLNASVDVSVNADDFPKLAISVNITNREQTPLYGCWPDGGMCEIVIARSTGCSFNLDRAVTTAIVHYEVPHSSSYELVKRVTWNADVVPAGNYVVMATAAVGLNESIRGQALLSGYASIDVPNGTMYRPSSPYASFQTTALEQEDGVFVTANASRVADLEDASPHLLVRWDWEADGNWDTDWSESKVASHVYRRSGNYTIVLQVKDSDGLVTEISKAVAVSAPSSSHGLYPYLLVAGIAAAAGITIVFFLRRRGRAGQSRPDIRDTRARQS
ncbi:MAG: PKD domain-containing protein [Thermoplasmata archaeon]